MILIKCKCGNHFTLDNTVARKKIENKLNFKCPNCEVTLNIAASDEVRCALDVARASDLTMYSLPDDAKLKITFMP